MSARRARFAALVTSLVAFGLLAGCPQSPPPHDNGGNPPPTSQPYHQTILTEVLPNGYQGPQTCQLCHGDIARAIGQTGHWNWAGVSVNIVGHEQETHGKRDLLSSFYIGVPSNEARCAQCHPSYGYTDKTFNFADTSNVDCLICHDSTGTYAKDATAAGGAAALVVNGQTTPVTAAQLQNVAYNVNLPTRRNCGACHFYADGGDNVKHGDMSSDLAQPTRAMDVHMGGLDFKCQTCHTQKDHGIAGFSLHSVDEGGAPPRCTRCHGATNVHTQNVALNDLLNLHLARVACESCHIPTFARSKPTLVAWNWDTAGQDFSVVPVDAQGRPVYDKQKGTLAWDQNIRPTYRWFNGKWKRLLIGTADTYSNGGSADDPVVLAEPVATKDDADAKVHPFKVMRGRQPADTVNKRLIVPHLFGSAAGPNAFLDKFDWSTAIAEGAAYSGVPYSGTFAFPHTIMYLRVSHEIAPKEQALLCGSCHGHPDFWSSLGLVDPLAPPK